MLEDRLGESLVVRTGMGTVGVGSEVGMVLSDRCGGAVIARPVFSNLGRVGVLRSSSSSSSSLLGDKTAAGSKPTSWATSVLSRSSCVGAVLCFEATLPSSALSE